MESDCFVYNGFSAQDLRLLYGHNNPEPIYIRMHRIKTKIARQLESAEKPEKIYAETLQ